MIPIWEETMDHTEGFLKLVNEAKARIHEVTVDEVRAQQQRKENFVFVDVREDSEWAQGRAEGSIHLGKGIIERDIENKIPQKNSEIVLYCGGGYRSALAADALQRMGYTNVHSMAGGIKTWRDRGLPVIK
jgi:rhodanese-related sulfurtransferase